MTIEFINGNQSPWVCCEGLALPFMVADACENRCMQDMCEKAMKRHIEDGNSYTPPCADGVTCGFDMNACLAGDWHQQWIDLPGPYNPDYWLRAQCNNVHSQEPVGPDYNIFAWHDYPDNDPSDDPPMCMPAEAPNQAPGVTIGDNVAVEGTGMTAVVSWVLGSSTFVQSSQNVALRFAYDISSCGTTAQCLDLTELRLSLPPVTVQGISIENAHLSVYQVDTRPVLQSTGGFSYAPGTLHAIMSATAGGIPIMLQGSNTGTATGLLAPQSDVLTLSGLTFDYSDSVITAQLQVSIVGDYTVRGPTAVIVPVTVPISCTDPVTFHAASSDPDAQSLTHYWWVPNALVDTGPNLNVVLANGTHTITLFAKDADDRLDATTIHYTRTCR